MRVDLFDFDLPRDRIASRPAVPRDASGLLVVRADGRLEHRRFRDLPSLLRPRDLLVINDTRVIPARLAARRGGAGVEITLTRPLDSERWLALARPARKLAEGAVLDIAPGFGARVVAKGARGEATLVFDTDGRPLEELLERHGAAPLPPYVKRPRGADERDRSDYQTVYAARPGAVAAPTAGLHFTPGLFRRLEHRGIDTTEVTLHVGPGTFRPVLAVDTESHGMEAEWGRVGARACERVHAARAAGGRVVAVGSTSLRLLETAARADGRVTPFEGSTALFVTPGYRFRAVDLLITNFHLPRSTLFMLVCAFAGLERMKAAYGEAVASGYRFYSYGDACLLEPGP